MAKNNKKGGFNVMDFVIVGGIAAVAYFLFSSFSRGPKKEEPTKDPVITPPNPTGPVTQSNTQSSGGSGKDFVRFTEAVINKDLLKGNSNNNVDAVKAVQLFLTKSGYNTQGIDGVFGTNTETALDLYLGSSQLLPTPINLFDLGIEAVKFSTGQIFGYDPKTSFLRTGTFDEYIGRQWEMTNDSIKATTGNL